MQRAQRRLPDKIQNDDYISLNVNALMDTYDVLGRAERKRYSRGRSKTALVMIHYCAVIEIFGQHLLAKNVARPICIYLAAGVYCDYNNACIQRQHLTKSKSLKKNSLSILSLYAFFSNSNQIYIGNGSK